MRIAFVIPYFYPAWEYGGPPKVAYDLARALVGRGHEIRVLTTDSAGSARLGRENLNRPIDGIAVRHYRNISNSLAFRRRLFLPAGISRPMRRELTGCDIVHIHEFRSFLTVAAHSACRHLSIPYVLSPHGALERLGKERAKQVFDRMWGRRILADASRIAALSPLEAGQARHFDVPDSRIETIPNAVALEDYANLPSPGAFRARWRISQSKILLFLGRLHWIKGVDLLVRAFSRIAATDPDIHLVLAGPDDGQESELRRLVRDFRIDARVTWTGFLDHAEKLDAFADATLVVIPSRREMFPVTVVEALLSARPVVLSSGSGFFPLPEARSGVRLFSSGNDEDLYRKLSECLSDEEFRSGARRGRDFAIREFGIEPVSVRTEAMYSEIAAHSGQKSAAGRLQC